MTKTHPKPALNPIKPTVQTIYTDQVIISIVQGKRASHMSLRHIAAEYGQPITHNDIQRILEGVLPVSAAKRRRLGLPPICPHCDQIIPRRKLVPSWVGHAADFLRAQERLSHG